MSNFLFNVLHDTEGFIELVRAVKSKTTPVMATGVLDSQKCHVVSAAMDALKRPAVIVTYSELKARDIYEDMSYFLKDKVKFYPAKDVIFYSSNVKSADIIKQRFDIIKSLLDGEDFCIVLSAEALQDRLTPQRVFSDNIITLAPGLVIEIETIARRLVHMGYERVDLVEAPGHFAVRGGILDLYTTVYENALRIDFYGDEIDNIKLLDTYSQRSVEKLKEAIIYPMRELVYDDETLRLAIKNITKEFESVYLKYTKSDYDKNTAEQAERLREHIQFVLERMRNSETGAVSLDEFVGFFYPQTGGLLSYLPKDTLLFFDEPNRISQHMEIVYNEFVESIQNRILAGRLLPSQADMVFTYSRILSDAQQFDNVVLSSITARQFDFTPRAMASFSVKSIALYQYSTLNEDLKYRRDAGYRVIILAGGRYQAQKLTEEIIAMGYSAAYCDNLQEINPQTGVVAITRGALKAGFEYTVEKLAVLCLKSNATEKKKRRNVKQKSSKIESFTDLRIGDYIVHENHGIGVYEGIEQITIDDVRRDFIKLSYADGGKLFVQTGQMDMIQKYIGGDGAKARLSKLNGAEWNKAKSRARKAVAILAKDLVQLYAKRQRSKGFSYGKDDVWQRQFEDTFPFEETEDQLTAIADVKNDMERGKVMDRLICGDVGYGKTEVAIRAAFKTVRESRQVAYLAPTTILAQQHYNTFVQRMRDFPFEIEMLSRFRTSKEISETLERLQNGSCDIVIGTHRLLSKDVKFYSLGLIIVDEEQRFGVTHKEKLKNLRENVNVLTLTATPIPRTLHMSLSGIRDMSVLEEPPHERQPIQTYVLEFSPEYVRDAISREMSRHGQVYYLHNRVNNIAEEAHRVSLLVPSANVSYAHGQMSKRELENIMMDFIKGDIDVLVCTTIIETGLDIPNVNTIIIQDADYMGLAQLYQLRGRVGRSNRLAYAYLMYRRDKVLTEVSQKRLQTIREFTEFGSGFKIAMRDLEIRGAGNLLGAEQHGHMDSIGYDMYCKLLSEEVMNLRGEPRTEEFETQIDVPISAFIPTEYIENEEQKLEIYKKIALIKSARDYYDVQEEIEDRYGDIPKSVANLLSVALLKCTAHSLGVISIAKKNKNLIISFKPDSTIDVRKLAKTVGANTNLLFTQAPNPYLTYKLESGPLDDKINEVRGMLEGLM
ncbi:MAG: transcription-repair coupling factor [Clostridiales bacterium]|jgi:transcription-repair coupling factor (superfamily II helicase)|nr:transcription-repair coupling factor [Clostridiales bacterium]